MRGSVLPLLLLFVTLHKHCCGKWGIGVRPPFLSKESLETLQASGKLAGPGCPDHSWVFPRRGLCPVPQHLHRWLGSQFPYERVGTLLLFLPFMPGFNLSVLSFYSKEWAMIFLLPSSPLLQWVSWCHFHYLSALDHYRFSSSPCAISRPVSDGRHPNTTPACCITSAAGLFLQKTYTAADKSPELFLPPFPSFINSLHPKHILNGRGAKQPDDCCSCLQHLLETH